MRDTAQATSKPAGNRPARRPATGLSALSSGTASGTIPGWAAPVIRPYSNTARIGYARVRLWGGRSAVVIGVKRTGWIGFQWVGDDVRDRDGLIALWGVWTLRGGGRGR